MKSLQALLILICLFYIKGKGSERFSKKDTKALCEVVQGFEFSADDAERDHPTRKGKKRTKGIGSLGIRVQDLLVAVNITPKVMPLRHISDYYYFVKALPNSERGPPVC